MCVSIVLVLSLILTKRKAYIPLYSLYCCKVIQRKTLFTRKPIQIETCVLLPRISIMRTNGNSCCTRLAIFFMNNKKHSFCLAFLPESLSTYTETSEMLKSLRLINIFIYRKNIFGLIVPKYGTIGAKSIHDASSRGMHYLRLILKWE